MGTVILGLILAIISNDDYVTLYSVLCTLYSVLCTLYSVTGQPPDTYNPLTANMECIWVQLVSHRTIYSFIPINRNREMGDETGNG